MPGKIIVFNLLFACGNGSEKENIDTQQGQNEETDTGTDELDTGDTGTDELDTGDTGDTADTGDTGDTGDTDELDPISSAELIAAELGLGGLNLQLEISDIEEQQLFGGLSFTEAFEKNLQSILNDGTDEESPLTMAGDQNRLISFLNDGQSKLWLIPDRDRLSTDEWFPPEYGESSEENWLFHLTSPSISDHLFWVIVPRDGGNPWNYGFN